MAYWQAAGAVASSAISAGGAMQANNINRKAAKYMYKNRYQWQVEDMKKAGLNPMLSYGMSAPVPNTPQAANVGEAMVSGAAKGAGLVTAGKLAKAQISNIEADTSLKGSATALNVTSARESAIRAGIAEASLPYAAQNAEIGMLTLDRQFQVLGQQLEKIGYEGVSARQKVELDEKLNPLLLKAQELANMAAKADLSKKEVYGMLYDAVPDKETFRKVWDFIKDAPNWPERISKWGKGR